MKTYYSLRLAIEPRQVPQLLILAGYSITSQTLNEREPLHLNRILLYRRHTSVPIASAGLMVQPPSLLGMSASEGWL
jgi:hypothetical protein